MEAEASNDNFGAFSPQLAEKERTYLIQEIKDWLGI